MGEMTNIQAGDAFFVTGPSWGWYRSGWDNYRGWVPRAWSSWPDCPYSTLITKERAFINFRQMFVADEVRNAQEFRTARVQVPGLNDFVYIHIAKNRESWAHKVIPVMRGTEVVWNWAPEQ